MSMAASSCTERGIGGVDTLSIILTDAETAGLRLPLCGPGKEVIKGIKIKSGQGTIGESDFRASSGRRNREVLNGSKYLVRLSVG